MGIGLVWTSCVLRLNLFAAIVFAYAGTWLNSLGVTSTITGIVKNDSLCTHFTLVN